MLSGAVLCQGDNGNCDVMFACSISRAPQSDFPFGAVNLRSIDLTTSALEEVAT